MDAPVKPEPANAWLKRYREASVSGDRPRGLHLERIVAAALAVADRDGLDALTMRHLASELGTRHTSLYRHVASRDELIELVVDHAIGELVLPDATLPWREHTAALARNYRRVLLDHQALLPAFGPALMGPNVMRLREAALPPLLAIGLEPSVAAGAYLTIFHFVVGSVLLGGDRVPPASRTDTMAEVMDHIGDRYPTVRALARELAAFGGNDEFEFGLHALLDGVHTATDNASRRGAS